MHKMMFKNDSYFQGDVNVHYSIRCELKDCIIIDALIIYPMPQNEPWFKNQYCAWVCDFSIDEITPKKIRDILVSEEMICNGSSEILSSDEIDEYINEWVNS